jgi:hypothetical protein
MGDLNGGSLTILKSCLNSGSSSYHHTETSSMTHPWTQQHCSDSLVLSSTMQRQIFERVQVPLQLLHQRHKVVYNCSAIEIAKIPRQKYDISHLLGFRELTKEASGNYISYARKYFKIL